MRFFAHLEHRDFISRAGFQSGGVCLVWALFLCGAVLGAEPARLRVITTILPAYAVASAVAGDQATVENLLPPGAGPHDYQLTAGDLRKIQAAQLVVQNGLGLDHWVQRAFQSNPALELVSLCDGLDKELIEDSVSADGSTAHHSSPNPHLWLDPRLLMRAATNVLRGFQKANPARAAAYATNTSLFVGRLKKLDDDLRERLAPVRDRGFVTAHNAFAYFARAYQLHVLGVLELIHDVPPSPRHLGDMMQIIRREKAPVIFTDPNSPRRLADRVAADLKIRVAVLDTYESGSAGPGAYEAALRQNAAILVRELKPPAP